MIDERLERIAGELKDVVKDSKRQALAALENIPEGDTRKKLHALLKRATAGKLSQEQAQKEINEIIKNAG